MPYHSDLTPMDANFNQIAHFLRHNLQIPEEQIPTILQQCGSTPSRLLIVLWQNQLVSLTQIDDLCDWLAQHRATSRLAITGLG